MTTRYFSMQDYWDSRVENWTPELFFHEGTDWSAWQATAAGRLRQLLGDFPSPVPLQAEIERCWQEDNLIYERVVFNSEERMSVPCILLRRADLPADERHPAVLCVHGHGAFGKDPVAGLCPTPEHEAEMARHDYDYARKLARKGFVTLAPDLRGFGERKDGVDPFPGRDRCNINFIKGALIGAYTLTLNIWDMTCCVDYLQSRPEVDPHRIGMMGLSYGGTVTAFTTAVDPRIRAACVCGYGGSFRDFAINRGNFCGAQTLPEIYRYFDLPELLGLIAPRPLLLHMGERDDNFYFSEMTQGAGRVERIYAAAGAPTCLEREIHPGGHAYGGQRTPLFFKNYL